MFFLNLYLSYDPIEVSVCWPVHLKIPLADLVDGLDIGQMDIAMHWTSDIVKFQKTGNPLNLVVHKETDIDWLKACMGR